MSDTKGKALLMFDLGAHKGHDTAYYLGKGWRTITVEAHPDLVRECDQRFHLQRLECRVIHRAITPDGKPAKLWTSTKGHHGETHSIFPHRVKRPEEVAVPVEGTTLGYLLKTFGVPDYLKVDIEGADIVAIRQLHEWQTTGRTHPDRAVPQYLSVELDRDHPEEALEIFSHLAYMGYTRFSLVKQHWDNTVDVDKVDHRLTLDAAAGLWFATIAKGEMPKDCWYDLHAIREPRQ